MADAENVAEQVAETVENVVGNAVAQANERAEAAEILNEQLTAAALEGERARQILDLQMEIAECQNDLLDSNEENETYRGQLADLQTRLASLETKIMTTPTEPARPPESSQSIPPQSTPPETVTVETPTAEITVEPENNPPPSSEVEAALPAPAKPRRFKVL